MARCEIYLTVPNDRIWYSASTRESPLLEMVGVDLSIMDGRGSLECTSQIGRLHKMKD